MEGRGWNRMIEGEGHAERRLEKSDDEGSIALRLYWQFVWCSYCEFVGG